MKTQDYIREFATIFFIRKRTILGSTLGALLLGVLIVLFWPATYQAQGALILKGSTILQAQEALGKVNAKVDPIRETDLYSDMEIFKSQDVIHGAIMRLAKDGLFDIDTADEEEVTKIARRIQKNLATNLIPRSNVIRVSVNWGDPDEAKLILSSIFEEYLKRRQAVFNPQEEEVFFKTQLNAFHASLDELDKSLLTIAGGSNTNELRDRIRRNIELQGSLRRELNALETKRIEKDIHVKFLERSLKEKGVNFFTAIDNLELGALAKKIADLLIKQEEQLMTYTENSPEIKRSQQRIDRLYSLFHREAARYIAKERSALDGIMKQITSIESRLAKIEDENRGLYQNIMNAKRLDREREVIEDSYKTFATRFREAKIRNETQSDRLFTVGIVEQAHASDRPIFPNPSKVLPTSLILGLLLGITIGFFAEFFDHRFKRPEDVDNYTGLSYLFSVPDYT